MVFRCIDTIISWDDVHKTVQSKRFTVAEEIGASEDAVEEPLAKKNRPVFACEVCARTFTTKKVLDNHLKSKVHTKRIADLEDMRKQLTLEQVGVQAK